MSSIPIDPRTSGPPRLSIEPVPAATAEAIELIAELDRALGALYAEEQRHGLSLDRLFQDHIRFFLARWDGRAVGCGGVALFADFAEVKRMYTRAQARGRGVATALLRRLEAEARAAGAPVLRLETGVHQREAIAFYERMGFRRRGPFGPYAEMPPNAIATSLFYEKPL
jgi:putative acetyltransferase